MAMGVSKTYLPADEAARINEIKTRSEEAVSALDEEIYQLVVVRGRTIAAVARASGANEETLKKRVARIRRERSSVQQHEAA